jgi:hypothetical protein
MNLCSVYLYFSRCSEGKLLTCNFSGFVTVALAFIQPFVALLRCDPMHRFRWIFNWIHWIIGNSPFSISPQCLYSKNQMFLQLVQLILDVAREFLLAICFYFQPTEQ